MVLGIATLLSRMYTMYHEATLRMGLTDAEHITLYILCQNGGSCGKGELYKKSGLTRMSLSNALNKLLSFECITVARNPEKTVTLTKKGAEFSEQTVKKVMDIENEVLTGWDEEDRNALIELCTRYLTQVGDKINDIK